MIETITQAKKNKRESAESAERVESNKSGKAKIAKEKRNKVVIKKVKKRRNVTTRLSNIKNKGIEERRVRPEDGLRPDRIKTRPYWLELPEENLGHILNRNVVKQLEQNRDFLREAFSNRFKNEDIEVFERIVFEYLGIHGQIKYLESGLVGNKFRPIFVKRRTVVPTMCGLAFYLGLTTAKLEKLAAKHKDYKEILDYAKQTCEAVLVDHALVGEVNNHMALRLLEKEHNWTEKDEHTVNVNTGVVFLPARGETEKKKEVKSTTKVIKVDRGEIKAIGGVNLPNR